MSVKSYIESNKEHFLEELFSLIRIPSISAKHEHKPDMEACARRWTEVLLSSGADKAVVMPTKGNPVVYGERIIRFINDCYLVCFEPRKKVVDIFIAINVTVNIVRDGANEPVLAKIVLGMKSLF